MNTNTDNIFDSISGYAVSGRASDSAYEKLRDVAASMQRNYLNDEAGERFYAECEYAEADFMETNYSSDPNARHTKGKRAGQWKYRTYLPVAYSTAKSELRKAMDAGIDVSTAGKSELAKQRKEASRSQRSPEERVRAALSSLKNALREIDAADFEATKEIVLHEIAETYK